MSCSGPHIVVLDCGLKYNILRILRRLGCKVTAVPCTYSAEQILEFKPDGIVLSPGPGDPALLGYIVETIKKLVGAKPIMGICLGEQLIGKAFGAATFKLKFGHRGGNHPVRELETGRVHITAQNHGYAVDADTLKGRIGGKPYQSERWHSRGSTPSRLAHNIHPIPLRSLPRSSGQPLPL